MPIAIGVPLRYKEQVPKRILQMGYAVITASNAASEDQWPINLKVAINRERIRQAFMATTHDYLFFLDSDVTPPPGLIEELKTLMEKHGADIAHHVYLYTHKTKGTFTDSRTKKTKVLFDGYAKMVYGIGCTLIKRKVLEKYVFSASQEEGEDHRFWVYSCNSGYKTLLVDVYPVKHKNRVNEPTGKIGKLAAKSIESFPTVTLAPTEINAA
jgi:hypothetical protein